MHRTETLDRIVDGFVWTAQGRGDGIVLPQEQIPICRIVIEHLTGLAKIKHEKVITVGSQRHGTGEQQWVYVHTKPDHFAHALNYANIAGSVEVYSGFAGFL